MRKILLVYNPRAGRNFSRKSAEQIAAGLVREGAAVTVKRTSCRGEATDFAVASVGYDMVVCAGGDGTLNETINGVLRIPQEYRPLLGYIPCGSTNDTATTLGIPTSLGKVSKLINSGNYMMCDTGVINDRHFICTCAFGYGTQASLTTPQSLKNKFGFLAYLFNAIRSLTDITPYKLKLTYDEGELEGEFLMGVLTNTHSVAGMFKLDTENIWQDDGKFELVLVSKIDSVVELPEVLGNLKKQTYDGRNLFLIQSEKFKFEFDGDVKVPWLVDGEYGGDYNVVNVCNLRKNIGLVCPNNPEIFLD